MSEPKSDYLIQKYKNSFNHHHKMSEPNLNNLFKSEQNSIAKSEQNSTSKGKKNQ